MHIPGDLCFNYSRFQLVQSRTFFSLSLSQFRKKQKIFRKKSFQFHRIEGNFVRLRK